LAFAGAASVVYSSSTNGTLQIRADPSMRARVLALYIMAFMGSTAIGGPLVGGAGQVFGPRASLGVGAAGCLAAVVLALAFGLGARRPAASSRLYVETAQRPGTRSRSSVLRRFWSLR
jgi:MFS family permease